MTTKTQEATARPYTVKRDEVGKEWLVLDAGGYVCSTHYKMHAQSVADALNAHDAMREALIKARDDLEMSGKPILGNPTYAAIRVALKLAGEYP